MKRAKYQKVIDRDCIIVERITAIKAEHPFWGYRRVWAHLKYIDQMPFNQKRIYRIMRDHNLLVKKNMKLKAIRRANTKKPKPTRPNQWWGIDMTKVMLEGFGWIYITICIDWYTKKIVGYEAGLQSKAWHCLKVLNKGVNQQFPDGIRGHELHLMSDNGCQPSDPGGRTNYGITQSTLDLLNKHDRMKDKGLPQDVEHLTPADSVRIQKEYYIPHLQLDKLESEIEVLDPKLSNNKEVDLLYHHILDAGVNHKEASELEKEIKSMRNY